MKDSPTYRLSRSFAEHMQDAVGRATLEKVNKTNRTRPTGSYSCASHDACDPWAHMAAAFLSTLGRVHNDLSADDMATISGAWSLARSASFWTDEVPA